MSDSDAPISTVSVAGDGAADGNGAVALVSTIGNAAALADDWSGWALAGGDAQPADQGMDLVNASGGDWFPSVAASGVASMALASDADPLVSLSAPDLAADFAPSLTDAGHAAGMDGGDATAEASHPVMATASLWETLVLPIDHGAPLDHIEWHFSGLLPLV